jgi:hypothetical protein
MSYIAKIMSDQQGRKFINELIAFCGLYQSSDGTVNDLLRREGKKQVGLYLLSQIQENNRSQYYVMQEEAYLASKEKDDEQRKHSERSIKDHDTGTDFDIDLYFSRSEASGSHDSGEGLDL